MINNIINIQMCKIPLPTVSMPAANHKLSPGKSGRATKPVSLKNN
jgi:hypothetical protein